MAKYLLEAPDQEMDAWKAEAKTSGLSFAEWLRRRIRSGTAAPATAIPPAARDLAGPARPDPRPSSKR